MRKRTVDWHAICVRSQVFCISLFLWVVKGLRPICSRVWSIDNRTEVGAIEEGCRLNMSAQIIACPARAGTDFSRPAFCLFGLAFDHLTMDDVLQLAADSFKNRTRVVLSTPNVNHAVAVQYNSAFRDAVVRSDLVVADGMPLIWIARLLGIKTSRLAGSDFFERLTEGDAGVLRAFFFGAPEGMAELAAHKLTRASGAVYGAGGYYPGFGTLDEMASPQVAAKINAANPDFVVVALGAVKGQAWIEQIQPYLTAPMISHLGAVVNFIAGSVRRAPWFLQVTGMEWMWRIREEPGLWRRYFDDACGLAKLLWRSTLPLVARRCVARCLPQGKPAAINVRRDDERDHWHVVMSGSWLDTDLPKLAQMLNEITVVPGQIVVDASLLEWVDQAILAQLIRLRGHQSRLGLALRFERPATPFVNALKLHCAAYLL